MAVHQVGRQAELAAALRPKQSRWDAGVVAARIHDPTFIGDVGRKTRSILIKREGRPRSYINNADPIVVPASPIQRQRFTNSPDDPFSS